MSTRIPHQVIAEGFDTFAGAWHWVEQEVVGRGADPALYHVRAAGDEHAGTFIVAKYVPLRGES